MSAYFCPQLKFRVENKSNQPAIGGEVYCYVAGTYTPQDTFKDSAGTVPNDHPIVLDYRGECQLKLEDEKAYRIIVVNSGGDPQNQADQIWFEDNVFSIASTDPSRIIDITLDSQSLYGNITESTAEGTSVPITSDFSTGLSNDIPNRGAVVDYLEDNYVGNTGNQTIDGDLDVSGNITSGGDDVFKFKTNAGDSPGYSDSKITSGKRIDVDTTGSSAVISSNGVSDYLVYRYLADTAQQVPAPTAGYIRWDNVTQKDATELYINVQNADTTDISDFFASVLEVGNELVFTNTSDPQRNIKYKITSITDNGYYTIGVQWISGVLQFALNDQIVMSYVAAVPKNDSLITLEPTGFKNSASIVVNYDQVARTITLTGDVEAYYLGVHIEELTNGWVSEPHAENPTTGLFLYYDGNDFVWSTSPWTFYQMQIAYVSYDLGGNFLFGLRETHGFMPWQVHKELHSVVGTYRTSETGILSSYTLNSTVAADRRPIVSACEINDEDLSTLLPTLNNGSYTHGYLSGTDTINLVTGNSDIVPLSGNQPYYNEFNGSEWVQTLVSNSDYMNVWLVAVPATSDTESNQKRFIWAQGQELFSTRTGAQLKDPRSLNYGQFGNLAPEFVIITHIVLRYIGGNWQITDVIDIEGSRIGQTASTGSIDYTKFPYTPQTTPPTPTVEGLTYYDSNERSLVVQTGPNTNMNVGHESWVDIENTTTSTITNGQVLYITGGKTGLTQPVGTVELAQSNSISTCNGIVVATQDLIVGEEGKATSFGRVNDIDTSMFAVNDVVYVNPTTAGGLTATRPTYPNVAIKVGHILVSSATEGVLLVLSDHSASNIGILGSDQTWSGVNTFNQVGIGGAPTGAETLLVTGSSKFAGLTISTTDPLGSTAGDIELNYQDINVAGNSKRMNIGWERRVNGSDWNSAQYILRPNIDGALDKERFGWRNFSGVGQWFTDGDFSAGSIISDGEVISGTYSAATTSTANWIDMCSAVDGNIFIVTGVNGSANNHMTSIVTMPVDGSGAIEAIIQAVGMQCVYQISGGMFQIKTAGNYSDAEIRVIKLLG